jgi:hypothetical protein
MWFAIWLRQRPNIEIADAVMSNLFDVVRVSGSDARSFLQGQLTQDVARLEKTPSLPAAWCNPKGRVITLMRMIDDLNSRDDIGLVIPAALTGAVVQRLLMFRFRAKVEVTAIDGAFSAFAVSGDEDLAALEALDLLPPAGPGSAARNRGLVAVDAGAQPRCIEVYGSTSAMQAADLIPSRPLSETEWQLGLIHAGMPVIDAATTEKFTPHMLNLDRLGAVSFTKGCYTGQEVVARTEHLGKIKRRLMHLRTDGPGARTGDKLRYEQSDAGEVLNAVGEHLLAVVPVELHGRTLLLGGRSAAPVALPYALHDQPAEQSHRRVE